MRILVRIFFLIGAKLSIFSASAQEKLNNRAPIINRGYIRIEYSMAKPKHPYLLCNTLNNSWNNYIKSNPSFKEKFSMRGTSIGYYGAFQIEIDKNGMVSQIANPKEFMKLEVYCYKALNKTIRKSDWFPAFNGKYPNINYLNKNVMLYFFIDTKYKLSIRFSDADTGYTLFKCNKSS